MTIKTLVQRTILTLAVSLSLMASAFAQTLNSTTLAAAQGASDTTISLTSASAASGSSYGAVQVGQGIYVDQEYEIISGTTSTSTIFSVIRRNNRVSTPQTTHATGATVYIAAGAAFQHKDPTVGACISTLQVDPWINVDSGDIWRCLASQWFNVVDEVVYVPATACSSSVSGNSTGTNGLTVAGTSNTIVVQAQTSSTGTNTHNYSCVLPAQSRANPSRAAFLADVTFFYGVQGGALGTQVATLASGTLNSVTVFGKITMPAAAASETASTVAPVRADAGTAVWTPVVASFNTGTTTAGAFYSEKLAPATPFVLSDSVMYLINVTLQAAATTATTTNTPGFLLHTYRVTGL